MNPKSLIPSLVIIIITIISSCGDNYQPESYPYSEVTIKDSVYYRNNKKIEYGNIFILEKNSDSTVLEIIGGELTYKKRYITGNKEDFIQDWFWTNGTERKIYKNGKANGPSASYDTEGNLKSTASYVNDKQEGPETTFRDDGTVHYIYTYKNGKKDGLYEQYNLSNEVFVRSMYKNDKEDGVTEWYRNNIVYKTETFRNGIKIDSNYSKGLNSIYQNEPIYSNLKGTNNSSQIINLTGSYYFETPYRKMNINIQTDKWFGWLEDGSGDGNYSGKTTIGGKMNGSDLYDEYGTEKRGYVSGNTIYYNDPLGEIKLSK